MGIIHQMAIKQTLHTSNETSQTPQVSFFLKAANNDVDEFAEIWLVFIPGIEGNMDSTAKDLVSCEIDKYNI